MQRGDNTRRKVIPSHMLIAPPKPDGGGVVSESGGVYCEINEVKLFALSAEDCEKAGGAVTTTVEPAETDKE